MIIQTADHRRGRDSAEAAVARAPAHIRAAINTTRQARGLPPILSVAERAALDEQLVAATAGAWRAASRGPTVTIDPASPLAARMGAGPVKRAAPATITRVILVAGVGLARRYANRAVCGRWISRGAFGSAAELNARGRMWHLVAGGHNGEMVELVGERLQAIDAEAPLVVAWTPDERVPSHRQAVRLIEAGHRSVSARYGLRDGDTSVGRLPQPTEVVSRAALEHLALLGPDERPSFPGSCATLYRDRPGDEAELRRQVEEAVRIAYRRSWFAEAAAGR